MNDRDQLLERLNAGRDELLAAVEGMTDQAASATPPGGGWSALGCVEHLATVETRLLARIHTQAIAVEEEMSREREPVLYDRIAARGQRVDAPEAAHPAGRYATLDEAIAAFLAARRQTAEWLEVCDFDLRRRAVEHPALGTTSVYELLLTMAAHPARHARQIWEAREGFGS